MNYETSLKILNLKYNYSYNDLKKAYHINALKYHPDKHNNNKEYNKKFQDINLAYKYLSEIKLETNNKDIHHNIDTSYSQLIIDFIYIITTNKKDKTKITNFKNDCHEILFTLLEQLNIENLEDIYLYISNNYENILFKNINNEILDKIKNLIYNKLKDYNIIILNPNIKNLINNEVYCLDLSDEIVYIPLWHNEFIYKKNIIKIVPELSGNISLHDNIINIIYKNTYQNIIDLISQNKDIYISDIELSIKIEKLYIKKYQRYIVQNTGISEINYKDIFNIEKRKDIIIHIYLE